MEQPTMLKKYSAPRTIAIILLLVLIVLHCVSFAYMVFPRAFWNSGYFYEDIQRASLILFNPMNFFLGWVGFCPVYSDMFAIFISIRVIIHLFRFSKTTYPLRKANQARSRIQFFTIWLTISCAFQAYASLDNTTAFFWFLSVCIVQLLVTIAADVTMRHQLNILKAIQNVPSSPYDTARTQTILPNNAIYRQPNAAPQYTQPQTAQPYTAAPQYAQPQTAQTYTAAPQYAQPQATQTYTSTPQYAQPQATQTYTSTPQYAQPQATQSYTATPQYAQLQTAQPYTATPQYAQPQAAQPYTTAPQYAQPNAALSYPYAPYAQTLSAPQAHEVSRESLPCVSNFPTSYCPLCDKYTVCCYYDSVKPR